MGILDPGAPSQFLVFFKFFVLGFTRTSRLAHTLHDEMADEAKVHTRSAKATPLAFLPVAFLGLVVFPNAFLLVVDDSNSAIPPVVSSENMLVFLGLFGAGGFPIPGS